MVPIELSRHNYIFWFIINIFSKTILSKNVTNIRKYSKIYIKIEMTSNITWWNGEKPRRRQSRLGPVDRNVVKRKNQSNAWRSRYREDERREKRNLSSFPVIKLKIVFIRRCTRPRFNVWPGWIIPSIPVSRRTNCETGFRTTRCVYRDAGTLTLHGSLPLSLFLFFQSISASQGNNHSPRSSPDPFLHLFRNARTWKIGDQRIC